MTGSYLQLPVRALMTVAHCAQAPEREAPTYGKESHAGAGAESASNVRFGPFELDLRKGELRIEGRWIRLQEQPFQIQRMLLESPGEVVSREEIRKRLWPDETVVRVMLSSRNSALIAGLPSPE
jgi:DNA-binding response OmpR family regulator